MIFSKDIFYVCIYRNKIEVKNVKTQQESMHVVTPTFSNDRMLVADFLTFENQLKLAIKEVHKPGVVKRRFKIIFHPIEDMVTEYSEVEKRSFTDSSEHAGASEVYLYFGKDKLSNKAIEEVLNAQYIIKK